MNNLTKSYIEKNVESLHLYGMNLIKILAFHIENYYNLYSGKSTCTWFYNEAFEFYETQCGNGYGTGETTSVQEKKPHHFSFCPFCGNIIDEKDVNIEYDILNKTNKK